MIAIAVVEDDASVLDATRLLIEAQGWEAQPYLDAESFLADRMDHPADCVLLDSHLPGRSGADIARALAGSSTPIVVVTAWPDSAVTRTIVMLGARAVITKPASDQELVATIIGLLRPSRTQGG